MAPRTCAMVFATTDYQADLGIEPIPQALRNCIDLLDFLQSSKTLNIQEGDLYFNINPSMAWVYERLNDVSDKKPSHFVFYYCGHGIPVNEDLVFPLAETKKVVLHNASLQHKLLAQRIRELSCTSLVLLDTCYSERFLKHLSGEGAVAQDIVSDFVGNEVIAIASARKYAGIKHPESSHTLFTGECIRQLRQGPGDESQYLTARSLFDNLKVAMNKIGGPAPSIIGDGKNFRLCKRAEAPASDGAPLVSDSKPDCLPSNELLLSLPSHEYSPERDGLSIHRHDYGYRRIPFIDFEETSRRINSFLYDSKDKPASWMVIEGTGGSGKSRLALEACLAAKKEGWDAGFFQAGHYQSAKFSFRRSTLVIFDDAETNFQSAVNLLLLLHAAPPPSGVLVRVMLLTRGRFISRENRVCFPWWRAFQANSLASILVDQSERLGFDDSILEMPQFTPGKLYQLISHVLVEIGVGSDAGAKEIDRFVKQFSQIDKFRRPLFATFFAEAIGIHGVSGIREWNRRDLLGHCLDKELNRWEFSRQSKDAAGLLTLSCVAGGEKLEICEKASGIGLPIPSAPSVKTLSALIGYNNWEDGCLIPLEPDILGELFVLLRLRGSLTLQSESPIQASKDAGQIVRFVLEARSERGKEFLRRCVLDFPEDDLVDSVVDLLCDCIDPDDVEFVGEIADALSANRNFIGSSRLIDKVLEVSSKLPDREASMFILRRARNQIEMNELQSIEDPLRRLANSNVFGSYEDRELSSEVMLLLAKLFFAQDKHKQARTELQKIKVMKDLSESFRGECDELMNSVLSHKNMRKLVGGESVKKSKARETAKQLLASMKKQPKWTQKKNLLGRILALPDCPEEVKGEACLLMIETYFDVKRGDSARALYERCQKDGHFGNEMSIDLVVRKGKVEERLRML